MKNTILVLADPNEPQLAELEKLRAEARKCVLLCSNCHAEVESGTASISGVAQFG